MQVVTIPTDPGPDAVEIRYPLAYPDDPGSAEYRWQIPRDDWAEAIEYLEDQPCLDYLRVVDPKTRTVDRVALFDGYDFGSDVRREALRKLFCWLAPPQVLRKLGLDGALGCR